MVGEDNEVRAEDLNSCFEKLMMVVGEGKVKEMEEYGVIRDWKDIPVELLLRIISLVDDRTVIMASGVCNGWRDAIASGPTYLSLVWFKKNMNDWVQSVAAKFKLQTLALRQDNGVIGDARNAGETKQSIVMSLDVEGLGRRVVDPAKYGEKPARNVNSKYSPRCIQQPR